MPLFHGRTLAFDEQASTAYATLRAQARARGFAIGNFDTPHPFEGTGIAVVNPFDDAADQ